MARKSCRKVEMVKMQNDRNLQVTFSKRRSGLFNKASELCTLCRAEVAILVFSPGDNVFSFDHPDVEPVLERFYSQDSHSPPPSGIMNLLQAHRNATICELSMQLNQVMNQVEAERERGEELEKMNKEMNQQWWGKPVAEMDKAQLERLKAALLELRQKVVDQGEKLLLGNPNSLQVMKENASAASMLMPKTMEHSDGMINRANKMIPHGFGPGLLDVLLSNE